MSKIIKLTEQDLRNIVERVIEDNISEQSVLPNLANLPFASILGMSIDKVLTLVPQSLLNTFNDKEPEIKGLDTKYSCINEHFRFSTHALVKKGYDKEILKLSLGIIGRESSFKSGDRYSAIEPLKVIGALLGTNSSVGPAQMKIATGKQLGLDLDVLTTNLGSLDGVYRLLNKLILKAKSQGYTESPSNLGDKGTGNSVYDIAIAAYNKGAGVIHRWCETDNPKVKRNCKDKGKVVESTTYTVSGREVLNYIPNYKTSRWDGVDISTHGYVKEVSNTYKTLTCLK